jgi:hypothetical protein
MKWALVIAFLTTPQDGTPAETVDQWVIPGFDSEAACEITIDSASWPLIQDYKLRHPGIADLPASLRCKPE